MVAGFAARLRPNAQPERCVLLGSDAFQEAPPTLLCGEPQMSQAASESRQVSSLLSPPVAVRSGRKLLFLGIAREKLA